MHEIGVTISIAFLGLLVFLAHLFAALFRKTMVPDVLLLVAIGLLVGPALKLVGPEDFGRLGPVFTTITLVVILFEGGLDLHVDEIRKRFARILWLSVSFFLLSMSLAAATVSLATGMDLFEAILFGAIVASVSPAVVVPLARQLNLGKGTQVLLALESATSDVLSILVAFGLIEVYQVGKTTIGSQVGHLLASFLLASLLGGASALTWSFFLNRMRALRHSMFTTPALLFVVFGLVEFLGYSGYIASLAFGIVLGNIRTLKESRLRAHLPLEPFCLNETENLFIQEVVFLLKTFFFVYVGISLVLSEWSVLLLGLFVAALIFASRPFAVRITLRASISRRDAVVASLMAPKGLAAAALASVPAQFSIPNADTIQDLAFTVVLFSIVLVSILVFLVEKTPFGHLLATLFKSFPEAETAPPDETALEEYKVWEEPGAPED